MHRRFNAARPTHVAKFCAACGLVAWLGIATLAHSPVQAAPTNHIGEEMAEIMIANGCRMKEEDLAVAMRNAGHPISDYQARVIALWRGGYMSAPTPKDLQLINWDECA